MQRNFFTVKSTYQENKKAFQPLSRFQLVHFSAHAVKSVLHIWEKRFPNDSRPRLAVEAALSFDAQRSLEATTAVRKMSLTEAIEADADSAALAVAYASVILYSPAMELILHAHATALQVVRALDSLDGKALKVRQQKWDWLYSLYCAIYKDGRVFPDNWKTPDVLALQKAAMTDTTLFPILADALEDAGCQEEDILLHLRLRHDLWTPADWCLTGVNYHADKNA